ncbi:MAG: hypothetical protein EOM19_01150 [Candidatus Moranbacteria bacterium]|nr:hypothetical protein [Candidatus Moranbacteria bacterium]
MKIFQTLKDFVFSKKEIVFSFFSYFKKYIGVLAIFVLVFWYNTVVSPVEKLSSEKEEEISNLSLNEIVTDLEDDRPEKVYKNIFDSLENDWYRITVRSQALDADEHIFVFALSDWGQEREVGELFLKKDEDSVYREFIFQTDDVYKDIVFRKAGEEKENTWRGGRVVFSDIDVTRLDITNREEAQALESSVIRQAFFQEILIEDIPSQDGKEIFFSDKEAFPLWGIFTSSGDRMLSVSFLAKSSQVERNAKYVVELREYSEQSGIVEKNVLHSRSFSESDVEKEMKKSGSVKLDFPVNIESGKEYMLGVRYRDRKKQGNLEFAPLVSEIGKQGFLLAQIQPSFDKNDEKNKLLLGAKIEDIGSYLRYGYKTEGSIIDFLNISDRSESISFSKKESRVLGDAKVGEFFVYALDTLRPFSEIVIRAQQFGNYEKQVAMEYSLNGKEWVDIPFTQSEDDPQNFFLRFESKERDQTSFLVRTRYAGKEDSKRKFGLETLYITAKIAKE